MKVKYMQVMYNWKYFVKNAHQNIQMHTYREQMT